MASGVLFSDGNGGADYTVVWRKADGSPVVRMGDGDSRAWSPDGKWALAKITSTSQIVVYPFGAGEPVRLASSPVNHIEWATWQADSRSVAFLGTEPSKAPRIYRQSIAGGPPQPILPESVHTAIFSPDGVHGGWRRRRWHMVDLSPQWGRTARHSWPGVGHRGGLQRRRPGADRAARHEGSVPAGPYRSLHRNANAVPGVRAGRLHWPRAHCFQRHRDEGGCLTVRLRVRQTPLHLVLRRPRGRSVVPFHHPLL